MFKHENYRRVVYGMLIVMAFFLAGYQAKGQTVLLKDSINSIDQYLLPITKLDSTLCKQINQHEKFAIHYFHGSCSFCIGTMIQHYGYFESFKNKKVQPLMITNTSDTILFNFYRDRDIPLAFVLWDKDELMANKFEYRKKGAFTCVIDNKGNVLVEGSPFENDILKKAYDELLVEE